MMSNPPSCCLPKPSDQHVPISSNSPNNILAVDSDAIRVPESWLRTCPRVDDDLQSGDVCPRHGQHVGALQQDRPRDPGRQGV